MAQEVLEGVTGHGGAGGAPGRAIIPFHEEVAGQPCDHASLDGARRHRAPRQGVEARQQRQQAVPPNA